ncbi:uncharacterized protein BO88DRAFT_113141 [Aspergillus vadensis CBS 113365]|uniref:Uncharacterized protein n=1 Tax=Aspergillus vadensis (strain CBS 113365 / IMI 142717 / IBT 24658) TaxID=1448311 RepID=A0A319BU05_ASPVC|nr:hypothetical protein BO88DRAFT_113141 [Aspergillus vadensis CBS 113365]PYH66608.1 hypothetical protein BO88DRAFT_113141 [Aspergillus vadensis CBS 113365]
MKNGFTFLVLLAQFLKFLKELTPMVCISPFLSYLPSFIMMNIVVAPIIPSMVTYTVQAKRTTEIFPHIRNLPISHCIVHC